MVANQGNTPTAQGGRRSAHARLDLNSTSSACGPVRRRVFEQSSALYTHRRTPPHDLSGPGTIASSVTPRFFMPVGQRRLTMRAQGPCEDAATAPSLYATGNCQRTVTLRRTLYYAACQTSWIASNRVRLVRTMTRSGTTRGGLSGWGTIKAVVVYTSVVVAPASP